MVPSVTLSREGYRRAAPGLSSSRRFIRSSRGARAGAEPGVVLTDRRAARRPVRLVRLAGSSRRTGLHLHLSSGGRTGEYGVFYGRSMAVRRGPTTGRAKGSKRVISWSAHYYRSIFGWDWLHYRFLPIGGHRSGFGRPRTPLQLNRRDFLPTSLNIVRIFYLPIGYLPR